MIFWHVPKDERVIAMQDQGLAVWSIHNRIFKEHGTYTVVCDISVWKKEIWGHTATWMLMHTAG